MMDLQDTCSNLQESSLAECAVCHQAIPKGRVHYGGVSCYSCRAFFRRNTQREELPSCKTGENCRVTHLDRKQCSACRYHKCIKIGMRPDLVLDASGKQERFKKYLRKKDEERKKADCGPMPSLDSLPPLQPIHRIPGYQINALLQLQQQARTSYHPLPFTFTEPITSRFTPSPPRTSHMAYPAFPFSLPPKQTALSPVPDNVKLTTHMLSTLQAKLSPHSHQALYHKSSRGHSEEQAFPLSLPSLISRDSVIASPPEFRDEEEMTRIHERESSSEEEGGASSSKRQYWPQIHHHGSPLPLQVEIKEEVLTEEDEPEERTEESLLDKYIHKKFSKAKTFSSILVPTENLTRRSVIVQAPPSKRRCSADLRNYRILRPDLVEGEETRRTDEVEEDRRLTMTEVLEQAGYSEEDQLPVDLSRSSPHSRSCTSSYGSSPRRNSESPGSCADHEVPSV